MTTTNPTLDEALDCSYTITRGGDGNWSGNTSTWYYGGDSAMNETICDDDGGVRV